jgi:HEAT repeat protein/doubled CXXCH motif protein/cytochrome c554/c'-like protein
MTKPIADARVEGDFRPGTRLQAYGRTYSMETRDKRYFISVARGSRPAESFEVNYTLGARRFQGYLSKLPDGRIYVLPVFWHNETKRWLDWKEITPIPDDPDHDLRQIWNVTCVNCHATNLVKNFDPSTNTYASTWTEMGIGCEACHGPGAPHVAITTEWDKNPLAAPANPSPEMLKIFSPKKAPPRQTFDMCGYCHGNKNNVFFGFKAGDRYEDFALPFLISQPIPDNDPQGDFWPDGRPSRFNRPQALTLTGCFQKGEATCTNCHRMHGPENAHMLKVPVEAPGGGHTKVSDTLCTQCHKTIGEAGRAGEAGQAGEAGRAGDARAWTEHTHHAADSQGSRCVNCHMSDVNWRLFTRRLDHTFQPPNPEMTGRYGVPNACTTCHDDRSPEWAASVMDRWYGNGERRSAIVSMADVLYRAGTGDTAVLPDVARLAVDRSHGALIRASAAEFAGQLMQKRATAETSERAEKKTNLSGGSAGSASSAVASATINALIGATADPEAMVRITAVRALGLVDDQRATAVLAAHLTDAARLVRVSAAEALMNRGISRLDGAVGSALQRAQDEWAESLRTFDDVAADHATLGWLEAARGRADEATKELMVAVRLDPTAARPHVFLGVLAARAARYGEALDQFKAAKSLAPAYPNLDRLIEEAQKRR